MKQENFASLGEFGIISRLTSGVKVSPSVITGIGDDAAVTTVSTGMQLLTSTDLLIEDIHFRRSWHNPYLLGRKSLAVNLSDIAAMGGVPCWTLLSLAIPKDLPLQFLDDFSKGFLDMAEEHGVTLIGGDTCASKSGLSISVTIMGEQIPDRIVRRGGAKVGDDIWVTGNLGDAAIALQLLENTMFIEQMPEHIISRLLNPSPRVEVGCALADFCAVTSMIDVSDGILADLGHIAEQSGVGAIIYSDKLPVSATCINLFSNDILIKHALTGGEDYELCFTANPDSRKKIADIVKKCGVTATHIGIVTNSKRVVVQDTFGVPLELDITNIGYNHFS